MANTMTNEQKKELAKILYVKENLTQQEIAERVGCSRPTAGKWIKDGNWAILKISTSMSKETELRNMYQQLTELNEIIMSRDKGERVATSKEQAAMHRITTSIRNLETKLGLTETINVLSELRDWIKSVDIDKARELAPLLDAFVQSKAAI